jgi:hypothetical protein
MTPPGATPPGAPPSNITPTGATAAAASRPITTPPGAPPRDTTHPSTTPPGAPPSNITPPGAPPSGAPWPGASSPSGDQPQTSSRNWIPIAAIGGVALVALGLVVVLLLTLGGSAGKDVKSASATREQALQLLAANGTTTISRAAPGLFALVSAGKLSATVPAGWRATAQAAGDAMRAEFADPAHPASTLTIVAQKVNGGSDHKQALSARKAVSSKGDTVSSFGPITFPGGREAWRLTYTATGATHATYFFSACNTHIAMVVDVATAGNVFQQQQGSLQELAASAEPQC